MSTKPHFDRVMADGFQRLATLRRQPNVNERLAIDSPSARRAQDVGAYIIASTIESASNGALVAVESIRPLKKLWAAGSFERAMDVTLPFALPTLSFLLNTLVETRTGPRELALAELDRHAPRLVDILTTCLIDEPAIDETVEIYRECQTQLRYEYFQLGGTDWSVLAAIVLADAIDALDGDPPIQGSLGSLPVTSFLEFMIRPCVRDRQLLADEVLTLQIKRVLDLTFTDARESFSEAALLRFNV